MSLGILVLKVFLRVNGEDKADWAMVVGSLARGGVR